MDIGKYVDYNYSHDYNHEEKTMSEIERVTDGTLDDHLEDIYVNYPGRSFRTDYHVHPKVLVKGSVIWLWSMLFHDHPAEL